MYENLQTQYRDSSKDFNLYIFKTPQKTEYLYMYKLSFTRNSIYLEGFPNAFYE